MSGRKLRLRVAAWRRTYGQILSRSLLQLFSLSGRVGAPQCSNRPCLWPPRGKERASATTFTGLRRPKTSWQVVSLPWRWWLMSKRGRYSNSKLSHSDNLMKSWCSFELAQHLTFFFRLDSASIIQWPYYILYKSSIYQIGAGFFFFFLTS